MSVEELMTCFPFFYFSGRGMSLFDLGSSTSPVGSRWLHLQPLMQEHVLEVMNQSTDRKDGSPAFPFVATLSNEKQAALADAVIEWTAGAPRSMLYVLHMIQQRVDDGEIGRAHV